MQTTLKKQKPSLLKIQYYVPPIFQRFASKYLFPFEHTHTDKYISIPVILNAKEQQTV